MKFNKRIIALLGAAAMVLPLAACGGGNDAAGDASGDEQIELTVWSWDSTLPRTVEGFEKENPNIKVTITNAGTNKDEYQALNNAMEAGSGAPDLAQIEYYALPEYVIRGYVQDLSRLRRRRFLRLLHPGHLGLGGHPGRRLRPADGLRPDGLVLQQGSHGQGRREPGRGRTWDDFYEAAKKVRATGSYITSDSGDAGFFDSMTWLAGATPFETGEDGTSVKINLTGDDKVQSFIDFWQKLIDEDLIDTKTAGWTDEWNRGLNDGSIASLLTGAWMPYNLLSGAPDGDGKWRIAQMPTLDGSETNSENGGSSLAVIKTDDEAKAEAAYKFAEYACHNADGVGVRVEGGAFRPTTRPSPPRTS